MKFCPKVKAIQLLSNKKGGSCLKPDGLKGKYTNEVIWMLKKVMELPVNSIITKEFTKRLVEAEDRSILPESFESLNYKHEGILDSDVKKLHKWVISKKRKTVLTYNDLWRIKEICRWFEYAYLHCLGHLINESAWGTSYQIRIRKNGFGIGVTDSRERRYKLKYLKIETSTYEWCSLLERLFFARGQTNEQLLNLDYKRYGKHPDWFNLKEIPTNWRPYATSQSKSVSVGLLVREMWELLNG